MEATKEQIDAVRAVARAIVETVREMGSMGAPAGPMYAALMTKGCTLEQFEQITGALVRTKQLVRRGDCFFIA